MTYPTQRSRDIFSDVSLARIVASLVLLAVVGGCNQGPSRIHPPSISPRKAGKLAMKQYDTNGDGKVSDEELDAAPALKSALARLDTNGDGGVSADEVAARVKMWQKTRVGLTTLSCNVTIDGRPLPGATVIFEPESFLGDNFQVAIGETGPYGRAKPKIPKENRPTADSPPGIQMGLFKVKVSKKSGDRELIPNKYNENTVLGQEIAFDVPEIAEQNVRFDIRTK